MRARSIVTLVVAIVLSAAVTGAAQPAHLDDELSQRLMARSLSVALGIACPDCEMGDLQRVMLSELVAHYSFRVKVGSGEYDVIELHRVVKERAPWVPERLADALFAMPGGTTSFGGTYLGEVPGITGNARPGTFLAEHGVDLWGISHSWALVPGTVTDLTFMNAWGLERQLDHASIGVAVARRMRSFDGNGDGRVILTGMSNGAIDGYAYLDRESQLPPGLRHVKAFIPIDQHLKLAQTDLRELACTRAAAQREALAAGSYADDSGNLMRMAGLAAELWPASGSPMVPGLNNLQAALLVGTNSYLFMTDNPTFHWTAGRFDQWGLPTGLQYMDTTFYLRFLRAFAPFYPRQLMLDYEDITCEASDVPFDDHLSQVSVPMLYVGAQGGYGDYGVYSTSLVGSTDITIHLVSTWPAEARAIDFGHLDLLYGDGAEELAWQPIVEWIRAHP